MIEAAVQRQAEDETMVQIRMAREQQAYARAASLGLSESRPQPEEEQNEEPDVEPVEEFQEASQKQVDDESVSPTAPDETSETSIWTPMIGS